MSHQQWIVSSCFQCNCVCCCFDLWHGRVNINSLCCGKAFLSCGALSDLPQESTFMFYQGDNHCSLTSWEICSSLNRWKFVHKCCQCFRHSDFEAWCIIFFWKNPAVVLRRIFRKGSGNSFCFSKARLVSSMRRNSLSAEYCVLKGSNCGVLGMSITCWCFHDNPEVLQSPVSLLEVPQIFLFWLPLDFPVAIS